MTKPRGVSFGKMEQAILEAAGDLFDRKGFNQTTLQDIADAIGMARPFCTTTSTTESRSLRPASTC